MNHHPSSAEYRQKNHQQKHLGEIRMQQLLVRFENERTIALTIPQLVGNDATNSKEPALESFIQQQLRRVLLSEHSSLRCDYGHNDSDGDFSACDFNHPLFVISHLSPPFCNATWSHRLRAIRGGKGGFGTLLKGQSRQASANTTKDFGACRDLQGRRLRHVNTAVTQALMQEWNERIAAGTATKDDMQKALLLQTDSGIAGWHLQVPAWSEVSYKRETQANRRVWRQHERQQQQRLQSQRDQVDRTQQQVASYVQSVDTATTSIEDAVSRALKKGLQKSKAKAIASTSSTTANEATTAKGDSDAANESSTSTTESAHKRLKEEPEPPAAIVTLSGDASLALFGASKWRLQGQSNFCTIGILLDLSLSEQSSMSPLNQQHQPLLYYEVALVTAEDVIQVGWTNDAGSFRPDSALGNGVGDCSHSWAYDVSRAVKLQGATSTSSHGADGKESSNNEDEAATTLPYGTKPCRLGDVVGCLWDTATGNMSYTVNGVDLGVAFTTAPRTASSQSSCAVAVSCNPGQIVELRLETPDCQYCPPNAVPIGQALLMTSDDAAASPQPTVAVAAQLDDADTKLPAAAIPVKEPKETEPTAAATETTKDPSEELEIRPWREYESADALQALGLERLKSALVEAGLKCGGTLAERAARLFTVRSLEPKNYPIKLLAKK